MPQCNNHFQKQSWFCMKSSFKQMNRVEICKIRSNGRQNWYFLVVVAYNLYTRSTYIFVSSFSDQFAGIFLRENARFMGRSGKKFLGFSGISFTSPKQAHSNGKLLLFCCCCWCILFFTSSKEESFEQQLKSHFSAIFYAKKQLSQLDLFFFFQGKEGKSYGLAQISW